MKPMVRDKITDPWRETTWEEAIGRVASEFRRIQGQYGRTAVGGITSSRCTNEEAYLVQKIIRAGFGVNNVDTCARVCHSPTGYGLKTAFGESSGTQDFDSVEHSDVILVIGANPPDAHPVFASRMKKRIREGAKLIVIDPRRTDLVKSAHIQADYHLPLQPGTNVAIVTAMGHVIATEGLINEQFVRERCELEDFNEWKAFVSEERNSPEAMEKYTGVKAELVRGAARLYATGGNAAIYYGLGVTEHSQGSTTVMAIANLAMATGNMSRPGVGVNPLRGQNNVQGSCDMASFPHELTGYRHISDAVTRAMFEKEWNCTLDPEPGLRIPNMLDAAVEGTFKAIYIQGEDILQSDPNTHHVAAGLEHMECVVVQDLFLNETADYAHVFLPGCTFLEKDGTFTNAERRIQMVTKMMRPKNGYGDWEITQMIAQKLGLGWNYKHPSEIMDEIARLTPDVHRRLLREDPQDGLRPVALQRAAPRGHADHARRHVRPRQGPVHDDGVRADRRTDRPALSADPDHGPHPVAVQRRRPDAPHGERRLACRGHPRDQSVRRRASRHQGRQLGHGSQPCRRDRAARVDHRPGRDGCRLHHVPSSVDAGERHHHRLLGLGDQLPRVQGDGGRGLALERPVDVPAGVRGVLRCDAAHRARRGCGVAP